MKLRATGQTLELVESERLVSGSVEIYTAAFEFDPAWDGYAKTAVFTDDMGRSAEIALTDNTCTVPWCARTGRTSRAAWHGRRAGTSGAQGRHRGARPAGAKR